ncbi:unnamed protein product [Symbiodinium sp. CCMP2592]|nr:unnamed protein product [Symbiodinium sp. CCMP2592]
MLRTSTAMKTSKFEVGGCFILLRSKLTQLRHVLIVQDAADPGVGHKQHPASFRSSRSIGGEPYVLLGCATGRRTSLWWRDEREVTGAGLGTWTWDCRDPRRRPEGERSFPKPAP